ncbi:MAG: sugar transferase [Rhodobacteraceae bacterium]|nr:sugar transferase [Paracoccaceae bacterium]
MFDFEFVGDHQVTEIRAIGASAGFVGRIFLFSKRSFDIVASILLLPLLAFFALWLLLLNPFLNSGGLMFFQTRMGRNCRPFQAFKFRSMRKVDQVARSADCPLETDRITPLGGFMRKTRIDELPQILNVLRGEMSLIGPRPDYFAHAIHYIDEVPGYRERHCVRPGISGLAQTEIGYVESVDATRRKVTADLYYIHNFGFRLEAWIVWRTFAVILGRAGS